MHQMFDRWPRPLIGFCFLTTRKSDNMVKANAAPQKVRCKDCTESYDTLEALNYHINTIHVSAEQAKAFRDKRTSAK